MFGFQPVHLVFILVILAEFAIPILVIVLIVRYVMRRNRPDPRVILAERLARGEISREQFDTAMQALGLGGPAGPTTWGGSGGAQPGPTTWSGPRKDPPSGS